MLKKDFFKFLQQQLQIMVIFFSRIFKLLPLPIEAFVSFLDYTLFCLLSVTANKKCISKILLRNVSKYCRYFNDDCFQEFTNLVSPPTTLGRPTRSSARLLFRTK